MGEKPHQYSAKRGPVRVYTCDVCSRRFEWRDQPGAEYHGSVKDLDDGNWDKITIACSQECKQEHKRRLQEPTPCP